MSSSREDKLFPVKNSISISILLSDSKKFDEVFWSDKLYKFHVNKKTVMGKEIIFEIRSLRVNEFIDILDEHKIIWRDLYSKY